MLLLFHVPCDAYSTCTQLQCAGEGRAEVGTGWEAAGDMANGRTSHLAVAVSDTGQDAEVAGLPWLGLAGGFE